MIKRIFILFAVLLLWSPLANAQNRIQYRICSNGYAPCDTWVDSLNTAGTNWATGHNISNAATTGQLKGLVWTLDRCDSWVKGKSQYYCYWSYPAYTAGNGLRYPGSSSSDWSWTRCFPDTTVGVNVNADTEAQACGGPKPPTDPPPSACSVGTDKTYIWQVPPTNSNNSQWSPFNGATDGNCEVQVSDVKRCWTTAGKLYCSYTGNTTGKQLSSSAEFPPPSTEPAPADDSSRVDVPTVKAPNALDCPKGTVQGGMSSDGVPLCIGKGSAPAAAKPDPTTTEKPPVTTTNPDGSTTTVKQSVQANADGSSTTTTTTTVKAADGTITVSQQKETSKTASGTEGKADSPDQSTLCKSNPQLTICKNSSVTGDCGAGYTCNGDAVQCATMQAARALECKQKKTEEELKASSLNALGKAVSDGNDPAKSSLPGVGNAEVVQMKTPEVSGWLGNGTYFKDKTIDLGDGHSLVLPLSKAENLMLALRYVTMIVASLVCFKIIRGTFAGSGV